MADREHIMDETISRFERIVNKIHAMERIPKDFGTGELLHLGQVNTIVAVGENPKSSITQLSSALGITKGAVSETVKKLEDRGYLKRMKASGNAKSVLVGLTSMGKKVCTMHEKNHREYLSKYFEEITFGQVAIFNEVLGKIEGYADNGFKKEH
jgi:DNA-binding MarR family transcriptional regulator